MIYRKRNLKNQIFQTSSKLFFPLIVFWMIGAGAVWCFAETLDEAWEIAIRENNQLKARQAAAAAASAGMEAAQAARMPRITNATAYTMLSEAPRYEMDLSGLKSSLSGLAQADPALGGALMGAIPSSVSSPLSNESFAVSTTQAILPIFTGGKITSLIEQAEARAEAARQNTKIDILDLKMGVAENYLLVLRMNRITQILKSTQEELRIHVQNTEQMVQKGIITENIYLAAQVSKAEIDQQILQAQQGFDLAKSAYNRFLARPLHAPVALESLKIPPLSGPIEIQTQLALENRPELKALAAQAAEACAKSREYRSERLPNMAVAGGYTYFENDNLSTNDVASASVCMVWTPIDGGVSRAKQKAANHQTTALNRMRDEARSGIELQVRQTWLNEREARNRLEVARKSVEQATRNLEIVRNQFNEGVSPHTDYLQAVSLKTRADVNFCNALCDAIIASFRLKRATGTI
ncbi:MAG: TolC family protein [Planctomycetia bacterium]|nr:TolC family protein [Planctomycetia bacterium]